MLAEHPIDVTPIKPDYDYDPERFRLHRKPKPATLSQSLTKPKGTGSNPVGRVPSIQARCG
jgi:hypothetical protein